MLHSAPPPEPTSQLPVDAVQVAASAEAHAVATPASPSPARALPEAFPPEFAASSTLLAQAIVPAADGIGTQVTPTPAPTGTQFNITGGQRSQDGSNLFHSFSQFGLTQGQIANFLSNPSIRNILTRVTGGDPSRINGTLQVTGGNSNLYLVNPAGILFGPSARLNLPAAFMATTANAVSMGCPTPGGACAGWFQANGPQDLARLVGDPAALSFAAAQPGAIANLGNLAVQPGQSLSLIGGTVLNLGQLLAPQGQITVAAIPGSQLVRLNPAGSLLSVEIQPPDPTAASPVPRSLAELLTGGTQEQANMVRVNERGEIVLTHSQTTIDPTPGTAIVAGQVDVAGPTGGKIAVLGDRVGLVGATLQASGQAGGGTILIGGDFQGKGTLPHAQQTYISPDTSLHADALQSGNGGKIILWSDNTTAFYGTVTARGALSPLGSPATATASNGGFVEVSGKQNLIFRGNADLSAPKGAIGQLLLDPTDILIVAGNGGAEDSLLPTIPFTASPSKTFTISQSALQNQMAAVTLAASNNITIAPGVFLNFAVGGGPIQLIADADNSGVGSVVMDPTQSIIAPARNLAISGADLTLGKLDTGRITAGTATGGSITLNAQNSVTAGSISTAAQATNPGILTSAAGSVTITAGKSITTGSITTSASTSPTPGSTATGGDVTLLAQGGNLVFSSIDTSGSTASTSRAGNVRLEANGVVQGTSSGTTILTAASTQSGTIAIQHTGGVNNAPFVVGDAAVNGTAGSLNAGGSAVITASTFPVLPNGGVAPGTPSSIQIVSVNQPPRLSVSPTLSGAVQDQPFVFTYADLAPVIQDANGDRTSLVVAAVNRGTLRVNGTDVIPGTTVLSPGDSLTYIPPAGQTGTISNAFSLTATDGISASVNPAPINISIASPVVNNPIPTPSNNPNSGNTPNNTPGGNVGSTDRPVFSSALTSLLLDTGPVPNADRTIAASLATSPCNTTDVGVNTLEARFTREYEEYLGKQFGSTKTQLLEACQTLNQVETATGVKPAVVYVSFVPEITPPAETGTQSKQLKASKSVEPQPADTDRLTLIAITGAGNPIYKQVSGAHRAEVLKVARQLVTDMTDPATRDTDSYLASSQKLYRWLVQPLEADLQKRQVQNLVFIMDAGLRSLPIAALQDGQRFLIEKYSLGLMPSLSITDTRYRNLKNSQILAMGVSKFTEQKSLPAVPIELSSILSRPWSGASFLNAAVTIDNLKAQRRREPFGIIHLATHAEFRPSNPENSYIQLWHSKLRLDQIRQLGWNDPPVELLVLSACRTALGDEQTELGFAGLAHQTGVRSVLASLWAVDDTGTLALMSEFYQRLKQAATRSEALRQAQVAMLRKQVRIEQGKLVTSGLSIPLPPDLAQLSEKDLSYPYYWAAFTLVGNPW